MLGHLLLALAYRQTGTNPFVCLWFLTVVIVTYSDTDDLSQTTDDSFQTK